MRGPTSAPAKSSPCPALAGSHPGRAIGIDMGADTVKVIELLDGGGTWRVGRRARVEHEKRPGSVLRDVLAGWDWPATAAAAVTGRFAEQVNLPRIPSQQAQLRAYRFAFGDAPATIVNIGSHGFSVLDVSASGQTVFRENSRCSQGTGNFLRQLLERFQLTVEEASALCRDVSDPASLSGRCPVILKTDMTHLANKGEDRARILAGLFDAVCENVLVLIKPGISPERVLLIGGVSRSPRVRRVLGESLARQGMTIVSVDEADSLYFEALGSALVAAESPSALPDLDGLLLPQRQLGVERLPGLASALCRVHRMPPQPWVAVDGRSHRLVIGLDIGSTGSKLVALDVATDDVVWDGYRQTLGDPVGAAHDLLRRFTDGPAGTCPIVAFGATGSGRDIVGSLLTSCYGKDAVFVVNEIVAHATGALHFNPRVDTIFEIGGQDAKYARLADGRIVDCAMNEACSAGTGSFIEEQGRKLAGVGDVRQLGETALAAASGVSLGQHCSVFMAEVIDEAVAAGIDQPSIVSGLYDSITKNYLNRVKGDRQVGDVIFCQGMPFSSDALAAAVARQTGSEVIVPPNPGTVGALGIALLAVRGLAVSRLVPLEPRCFLDARVEQKDTFVCRSTRGCGGVGSQCRIERLRTVVGGTRSSFTWGGGCALHDKATRKRKLPDRAPDPFRERDDLTRALLANLGPEPGRPRIAMTDEFMLKGLFPFFAAFFGAAGFALDVVDDPGPATLKRGIQAANVPFCAPMQLFHGLAQRMRDTDADWIFLPRLGSLPRARNQRVATVCPIVQATPDVVGWMMWGASSGRARRPHLLSAPINFGEDNLESTAFIEATKHLARQLNVDEATRRNAWHAGVAAQRRFDGSLLDIGRRALEFASARRIVPVVVLGRNYTIYNQVLNSNVPAILREQGAIGIPVDCYPLAADVPLFGDMYWGNGQTILRAAHQVRRTPGEYALYCSNYSCGPDSFNLHFAAHIMEGKPFAVIETDGHSGDAGTRTRVEAFLHCVDEDVRAPQRRCGQHDFAEVQVAPLSLRDLKGAKGAGPRQRLLVPYIGPASDAFAAVMRGLGFDSESLPPPDAESLRHGRRYTSGKECSPMTLTLGSLLQRLERAPHDERFVYLMPNTDGPCRFGVYNLLNRIVLDRLGLGDRVRIWAPKDTGYFDGMPVGVEMLMFAAIVATDLLLQARLDARPVERERGAADALYARFTRELLTLLESEARSDLSCLPALWQVTGGPMFGLRTLLEQAGAAFSAIRGRQGRPRVELAGEIYVRAVDFSNDFIIEKLEARGLQVVLSPKSEWVRYCEYNGRLEPGRNRLAGRVSQFVQSRIEATAVSAIAPRMGWPVPPSTAESLDAARPYLTSQLQGEAVLTLGSPLHAWRRGDIDAVVSVGPLECLPTKIAEAQFYRVAEREGFLTLTLYFNGDPMNTSPLDNFAFEVHERARRAGRMETDAPSLAHRPSGARSLPHPFSWDRPQTEP